MYPRVQRYVKLALGIAALLVAMPLAPARAQASQRCFAETGFCIDGRIREFWEQNGGLPVFGLPIAPQQEQQIEGQAFQVQWFERNRLELHPENKRPYDVLLGRLGADRLAQQGRDPFAFAKSDAQNGCRFFPETGHNVCGDILRAWRQSGIDLDGRRGKSEAESLALFGLPLGDQAAEIIEGQQYIVQWFERARFELHPENAPPYGVLLGRLGGETYVPPLRDVFAQSAGGEVFVFVNPPGTLDARFDGAASCRRAGQDGMHLTYSFTGVGNGGWGVRWEHGLDASSFDSLAFWVKGSAPKGFQIGVKDTSEREVKVEARDYVAVGADEWRKISVPLGAFADASGPINRAAIRNINVGFNPTHGAGDICIDDIAFEAPLAEIFPQASQGQPFQFFNPPGAFSVRIVESEACRHAGQFALRVDYGFSGVGNGGWGVKWNDAPAGRFDGSSFTSLRFWVKGSAPNGFQIGLRDSSEHEVKVETRDYLTVAADEWRLVQVPLSAFADGAGPIDRAAIRNVNVGFNPTHGAGGMCIDDIAFE